MSNYQVGVMTACLILAAAVVIYVSLRIITGKPDEPTTYPTCYGNYPVRSPQTAAEYDCPNCMFENVCFSRTCHAERMKPFVHTTETGHVMYHAPRSGQGDTGSKA